MKILVVDDEELLVKGIRFNLQKDGYDVIAGYSGVEAVSLAMSEKPDLIILDVMMPEMDGFTACAQIREISDVPIILLTAKSEDLDKLMGFDCGADDYITKPFNILELKARIKALLRRANHSAKQNLLTIGPISLDTNARNAYRSGSLTELTAKEYDMIEFLMKNPNRVYSREVLLDTIWSFDYRSDIRTVDVHIRRLREKLEENPAEPKHIMTKWGVGYYFKK